MRKTISIMMVAGFTATLFFACKKDDDKNASPSNASLINTWEANMMITSIDNQGTPMPVDTATYGPNELVVEYRNDGKAYMTMTDTSGVERDTADYTYVGSTLTVIDSDDDTTVYQAAISGNNLTLKATFDFLGTPAYIEQRFTKK